jgi:hypothetical protein
VGQTAWYGPAKSVSYVNQPISPSVYAASNPVYEKNTLTGILDSPFIQYHPPPAVIPLPTPALNLQSSPEEGLTNYKKYLAIGGILLTLALIYFFVLRKKRI